MSTEELKSHFTGVKYYQQDIIFKQLKAKKLIESYI